MDEGVLDEPVPGEALLEGKRVELPAVAPRLQAAAGPEEERVGEVVGVRGEAPLAEGDEEEEGLLRVGAAGVGPEHGVGAVGVGSAQGVEDGAGVGGVA